MSLLKLMRLIFLSSEKEAVLHDFGVELTGGRRLMARMCTYSSVTAKAILEGFLRDILN